LNWTQKTRKPSTIEVLLKRTSVIKKGPAKIGTNQKKWAMAKPKSLLKITAADRFLKTHC
jgi:hypothetical protein